MKWKRVKELPSASLAGKKFLCISQTPLGTEFYEIRDFVITKTYMGFDYKRQTQLVTHWMELPKSPVLTTDNQWGIISHYGRRQTHR